MVTLFGPPQTLDNQPFYFGAGIFRRWGHHPLPPHNPPFFLEVFSFPWFWSVFLCSLFSPHCDCVLFFSLEKAVCFAISTSVFKAYSPFCTPPSHKTPHPLAHSVSLPSLPPFSKYRSPPACYPLLRPQHMLFLHVWFSVTSGVFGVRGLSFQTSLLFISSSPCFESFHPRLLKRRIPPPTLRPETPSPATIPGGPSMLQSCFPSSTRFLYP